MNLVSANELKNKKHVFRHKLKVNYNATLLDLILEHLSIKES